MENHAEAPGITFKLLDADVLEAVAQATASRQVVHAHLSKRRLVLQLDMATRL